jgi:hypothetical protein
MGRKSVKEDEQEYAWCARRPVKLRFATIEFTSLMTGYTVGAIKQKIAKGVWQEGTMWKRSIDGRIIIDLQAYVRWVEGRI